MGLAMLEFKRNIGVEMKKYVASNSPCPIGRAARVLGDRWAILILREAMLGARKFEEFVERLQISRASLTSRLVMLQEAGLIERDPPESKRAVYGLTQAGADLAPVYQEIAKWSGRHLYPDSPPKTTWEQS